LKENGAMTDPLSAVIVRFRRGRARPKLEMFSPEIPKGGSLAEYGDFGGVSAVVVGRYR